MSYRKYKYVGACIRVIETGDIFGTGRECAEFLGASPSMVSQCISGKIKTCKGYHLEQINIGYDDMPERLRCELNSLMNTYENRIWKEYPYVPGVYVSTAGEVIKYVFGKWIVCEDYPAKGGYRRVLIDDNHYPMVNVVVAETFIPNPYNKPEVNHIDGDKTNNHVWNLEWVTKSENMLHAYRTGLIKPRSRPIKIIETGEVFENQYKCAETIGGNQQNISACLNGKRHKCMGYHFEYVDEEEYDG